MVGCSWEKAGERKKRKRLNKDKRKKKEKNERRRDKYSIFPLFNFQREMKGIFFNTYSP